MGYVSTRIGNHFSALLVSLMALHLMLVDQNPFRLCFILLFVKRVPLVRIFTYCGEATFLTLS